MKKTGLVFLAFALCLSLCACVANDSDMSNTAAAVVGTTPDGTVAPTMPMPTEPVEGTVPATELVEETTPATKPTQGSTNQESNNTPVSCDHSFSKATCQTPATCSQCGVTSGELADHSFNKNACSVCGAANPTYSKIAKALKDMERYPKYIAINKDLIATQYDLFNLNGDLKHFNDAHENTLQIQGYLKKVIEICEDYADDDFWIKEIVEDCQECILEMPIVPTSTGSSAIRSYISKCKTYSSKADRIFIVYKNLCETYGVE